MRGDQGNLLIVEDNPLVGNLLSRWLTERGHSVSLCDNGLLAVELMASGGFEAGGFDLILLDVGVPGLDGFDVLSTIRTKYTATTLPIIMATALGQSELIVKALEMGANDYVTKPYDLAVLLARVQTQLTLKRMVEQQTLLKQNLAERNAALEQANHLMKMDLQAAARVQEALLPPSGTVIPGLNLAWSFRPCEHLAGDTLNVFPLDSDHVGLYLLDVTGHGVPAALLSVHLSLILSPARDPSSFLMNKGSPASPAIVINTLNRRFAGLNSEQYFTLFYGVLNRHNGEFRYACAGHPGPVLLSTHSGNNILPPSGPPVGIVENEYDEHTLFLKPTDRLYLYSDGVTEAMNAEKVQFGTERLINLLVRELGASLDKSLEVLLLAIEEWHGGHSRDDISVLAVEFLRIP